MSSKPTQLQTYRVHQRAIAIDRDDAHCTICYFTKGITTGAVDVHHVYGRGKKPGDWRERYTSLLCVCRDCHPLPIQTRGGNQSLAYVEDVLRQANEKPINSKFKGSYHANSDES